MAKIERFEDLIAWQKARELRKAIRLATSGAQFRRELDFRSQIRRAGLSVMSNIAEGFERGSRADFARFLVISKASCGEVRSLLYAALDDELIDTVTLRVPVPPFTVQEAPRISQDALQVSPRVPFRAPWSHCSPGFTTPSPQIGAAG